MARIAAMKTAMVHEYRIIPLAGIKSRPFGIFMVIYRMINESRGMPILLRSRKRKRKKRNERTGTSAVLNYQV